MKKKILIEAEQEEIRLAVIEDDQLVQLFIERQIGRPVVGNIYKAKVTNIVPAIQAAFVDLGAGRNGFLYAKEAAVDGSPRRVNIDRLVHREEEVLVEITKEALGSKGPRVSRQVSLAGRFIVYLPEGKHIGVSKRVTDRAEHHRLKKILSSIIPARGGIIARTAAIGASEHDLIYDCQDLLKRWAQIEEKCQTTSAPCLLHAELPLISRIVRDIFNEEVGELLVNSPAEYERIVGTLELSHSDLQDRVRLYNRKEPMFKFYGLEEEIEKALRSRVALKSGGTIVIEETESLVTIDVNSGRFISKKNTEETALRTNIEAAREVVRQVRLRDIGGIIVIDFIDMEKAENRKKVMGVFKEELEHDRAKKKVLNISEFGLVEMTRERVKESLSKLFYSDCPCCEGRGVLLSEETVSINLRRQIRRVLGSSKVNEITLEVPPRLAEYLTGEEKMLEQLEQDFKKKFIVEIDEKMHPEKFKVILGGRREK